MARKLLTRSLRRDLSKPTDAKAPDFYLSTAGEYEGLAVPRACRIEARLSDRVRVDHLLVRIDPPLEGQGFGLGSRDIKQLVLTVIFDGTALFPIKEWPAHVYVARILDDSIVATGSIGSGQVQIIAWGTLFRTLAEATASIMTRPRVSVPRRPQTLTVPVIRFWGGKRGLRRGR